MKVHSNMITKNIRKLTKILLANNGTENNILEQFMNIIPINLCVCATCGKLHTDIYSNDIKITCVLC